MASRILLARENAKYAPAPPGVTPNYEHPASNGGMYMAGTLTTLVVAFICLLIRLGTKQWGPRRRLQWDDFLIVLAFLFSVARTACFAVDIYHYGIAHHVWDIPLPFNRNTWLLHRIADIMWPPGMLCAKLSILITYLQIFGHYRKFKWAVWGVMAFNIAYLGATTLVHIFWCTPVAATYGIKKPGQKAAVCIDGYKTDLSIGALNLLTDTIILILPMPMLYHLQLSKARKVAVASVFCVGAVTVGATIAREVEIADKLKNSETDQTWVVMYEALWISVELNTAIAASCMLLCQHFFKYILVESKFGHSMQSLLRTNRSSGSSQRSGGSSRYGQNETKAFDLTGNHGNST
ncbi:hypothetical protein BDV96DRAFT_562816 [Lophiotrema nucula]|uniref:Rhodopsin domain-containing protein n=1 Tax=Lophiotrema nucula TaxID=690887 RepID=A0A6A5ZUM2_9PLEO|nr:hypothetical protein BDV96DRAFT_562816 [Lophiotrema nucula]